MVPKKVLITGASGLIGTRLTELLMERGHEVAHLSLGQRSGNVKSFLWDVEEGKLDGQALVGQDAIIHLAGASIAKRWTRKQKKMILASRVKSTEFLFKNLQKGNHEIKTFISASAIGYYGFGSANKVFTEEDSPGYDFLADVTRQWENEVDKMQRLNIRTVKIRIGIVLSKNGGALKELLLPIRWGVGAPLGSGNQYMSWIHIDDLCRMFLFVLENENLKGAFNGTGTSAVTNRELTIAIAKKLKKPLWLPPIPAFVLKFMLGEMAVMVVQGSIVSSEKIWKAGFNFKFTDLERALQDLLKS